MWGIYSEEIPARVASSCVRKACKCTPGLGPEAHARYALSGKLHNLAFWHIVTPNSAILQCVRVNCEYAQIALLCMYIYMPHLFDVGPVARWTRHRPTGPRAAGSNTPFPTRGGGKFVHSCACTRGTIETKATACHSDQNRIQDSSARQPTLQIYRRSLPLNHHHGPIVENVVNWKPRNSLQQRSCASTVVFDY